MGRQEKEATAVQERKHRDAAEVGLPSRAGCSGPVLAALCPLLCLPGPKVAVLYTMPSMLQTIYITSLLFWHWLMHLGPYAFKWHASLCCLERDQYAVG